ncbi:MAG TPA: UDP-N-acetylmuramoyl-tripeptide--D-alanyl-D-alanine ligase, partial [Pyrinomonadaceae bacterium]
LCQITPPDIGVELMVAPVHLEYLGSIENIAAAKAELIEGLKPNGIAVLNADDRLVMGMRSKHSGRVITFGIDQAADISAAEIDTHHLGHISFRLKTPRGDSLAVLPMSGRHNLMNALAAAAVGSCFDFSAAQIAESLRTTQPPHMRGEVLEFAEGFTVVDDSYNSNPRSLVNMIHTITDARQNRKRLAVIAGEMLELGPDEAALHRQVGRDIAAAGIDFLWGVRGLASEIIKGANEAGLRTTRYFENSDEAASAIVTEVQQGDLILVKGSRGVATDKIVTALSSHFSLAGTNK